MFFSIFKQKGIWVEVPEPQDSTETTGPAMVQQARDP